MSEPNDGEVLFEDEVPTERTEESIAAAFPDRGEFPSNEVTVDPEAPPAPNVQHPE